MPSMMVHLAVAREYNAAGSGLYYFANLAPDYTDIKLMKDMIHLRDRPDRPEALSALKSSLDLDNPFELGWLLHLFADFRWDAEVIPKFRDSYSGGGNWFLAYRDEIGYLSFLLLREEPWSREIWAKINELELGEMKLITRTLPVPLELTWFARRIYSKHRNGKSQLPTVFTLEMAKQFAARTAKEFREWL